MISCSRRHAVLHTLAWSAAALLPAPARGFDNFKTIERVESLYNDIYLYQRPDGYYVLSFGARRLHYIESIVNPKDETELPVYYTQSMTAALAYADGLQRAAVIGLGGGRTAWYAHKSIPSLHVTGVDLDPAVVDIGKRYFGLREESTFKIVVRDGRVFLNATDDMFDVVFVDAYRGPFVPFHLLTREFFELARRHLNPGGVLAQNIEPTTMLFDSAVATIGSVFPNLEFFQGGGNIVLLAYDGQPKPKETIEKQAGERDAAFKLRYPLAQLLERRFAPDWNRATKPMTDDFAPVEYLKAIERHNLRRS
jgi:spermidine synthase